MNEQIRKLANKAGMVTEADFASGGHFAEKFAELIVRECMFQIKEEHNLKSNGTEPDGPYAHGFDDGMFVAIKTIKEHFGVEE